MPVVQEYENVIWNKHKRKFYETKGYSYTFDGDIFQVKVNDLPVSYYGDIECKCDYCGKLFKQKYKIICQTHGALVCGDCIKKKIENTCLEKYGVKHPWQNKDVCKKREKTWIEKHGVSHIGKSKEAHEKANLKRVENGNARTSEPENAYFSLIGRGIQAYPIFGKILDIALVEEKVDIEYDGGWHCKFHSKKDDNERDLLLKENGWKILRLITPTDTILSGDEFDKVLNICLKKLETVWKVEFYIDTNELKEFCN